MITNITGSSSSLKVKLHKMNKRMYLIHFNLEGQLTKGGFYALRHPRTSSKALYHINPSIPSSPISEVLKLQDSHKRSFFYGDSVIADGSFTILSPIHPLFLAIPYLMKQENMEKFKTLEDLMEDEEYPAVQLLSSNEKLGKALKLAADIKGEK